MRVLKITLLYLCCIGAAFNVLAEERPTDTEILKIQAIAGCIDDVYFQGGYDEGNAARIELIDTMLMLFNLPAYDEEYLYVDVPYDGELSSEVYYQCISGQRELLDEAADSLGVVAE